MLKGKAPVVAGSASGSGLNLPEVFLASDAAARVIGVSIPADGGRTAR